MNKVVKYAVVGLIILAVTPFLLGFLNRERIYYTEEERIVHLHSNKWGDETMDFYFQYPNYVEEYFLTHPAEATAQETSISFENGCAFVGSARVSDQYIDINGMFSQPTGAEWNYRLTRSLSLGGLVGVSGSADVTVPFTKNSRNYTVYISWTLPAGVTVFIQEGNNEKVKLTEHHLDSIF